MAEQRGDARALAWEILRRVDETGAFADALLGHRLATCGLERRDQALATQIVYGTLARRGFLSLAIETFAARPASSVEGPVRSLLEIALYQLFELERVPAYAAVASAVDLAKSYRGGRAAGFVNAVLRRAAREGASAVKLPDRGADLAAHLAALHSHPRWLVQLWLAQLGEAETEALLAADNRAAPTVLRVNCLRTNRERVLSELRAAGVEAQAGAVAPEAIYLEGDASAPAVAELFRQGALTYQSEASQLIARALAPEPGDMVLDACAGGGGKTTHLAELQEARGRVLALDLHHHALTRLRAEIGRLELKGVDTAVADARRLPSTARFHRILLDAPCSGLGTLRQHPEIRWRRTAADVDTCARLQQELLTSLLAALAPGGVLVYAVCTNVAAENEGVLETTLAAHPEIRREDLRAHLPAAAHDFVDGDGALRTGPHHGGLDGFYAVRLKRF